MTSSAWSGRGVSFGFRPAFSAADAVGEDEVGRDVAERRAVVFARPLPVAGGRRRAAGGLRRSRGYVGATAATAGYDERAGGEGEGDDEDGEVVAAHRALLGSSRKDREVGVKLDALQPTDAERSKAVVVLEPPNSRSTAWRLRQRSRQR
jgi:hypothetical protein